MIERDEAEGQMEVIRNFAANVPILLAFQMDGAEGRRLAKLSTPKKHARANDLR